MGEAKQRHTGRELTSSPPFSIKVVLVLMKIGESSGAVLMPDAKHGVDPHKRESLHSSGREERELKCQRGYYYHTAGTHCCMQCHKGTYVVEECLGPERTTNCSECGSGSYMPENNYSPRCLGCSRCRATLGQIEISSCKPEQDTICGCGNNQYQASGGSEFSCRNCSACENGKIRQHCTKFNDTICECHTNFFRRTGENNCSPCSSCNDEECKKLCDIMLTSKTSPSNSMEIIVTLGSFLVLIVFGCLVLLLAKRTNWQSCLKKKNFTSCFNSLDQAITREPTSKIDNKTNCSLRCQDDEVQQLSQASPAVLLPDCVRSARETQIPDNPKVLYTIVDNVPMLRWREFMRYLGLSDNTMERISIEQRHIREAQYEMLIQWKQQAGPGAFVERISNVLNQMNLTGCSEAIQEALTKQP
nr:PREDICTED: tumor necrosis factor receptor superfamily member 1A [Anolis carolinensis]|eukprot:XP_008118687.1 PREDICTED: tumor necrosis factor receptor superfamily member 1A [Anolis carolinensis]